MLSGSGTGSPSDLASTFPNHWEIPCPSHPRNSIAHFTTLYLNHADTTPELLNYSDSVYVITSDHAKQI